MFLSYRWLRRHVDLIGVTAQEVAEDLTIHTAEVEGVEPFAPALSDVIVGHVIERKPHPDADRLSVCRVDVGDEAPLSIVCGADNVAAGQKVAVGRVGTVLPGGLKLKKAKIRGVASHGMICSERELELGDEHSGIWVLPEEAEVGLPVAEALGIQDWIIEIENKSLTHRPDLWGHRGIASEIAAIRGLELKPLDLSMPETDAGEPYPIRVESAGCPRYLGLPVSNVRVEKSPDWLRFLLLAAGQRPIDLLVDLSNFVMLDLAQPNHLFDAGRLSSEGIVVRNARAGEKMKTLDEVERTFVAEDMLIVSGDEPVAVAGVMGGEASRVAEGTTDLLLEVAAFDAASVRRTAQRLGLRTDASTRFEKTLDPTLPEKAAAHLVRTLREIQPGITLPRPMGDAGEWTDPACTIALRPDRVRTVLGAAIGDDEVERILTSLGFVVERASATSWNVAVPSDRAAKDVELEEDLIEEVGRMFGYGNIDERPLEGLIVPTPRDERRALVEVLQDRLSGAARFHEAMTHTFQADDLLARLGVLDEPYVRIVNPQSEGVSRVRRAVLPGLLAVLASNGRQREDVRLFEIGKGYLIEEQNERGEPREVHQLAIVWAAPRPGKKARFDAGVFARLQSIVEDLVSAARRDAAAWTKADGADAPRWAHAGRCMRNRFATVAMLDPGIQRELDLQGELDAEVAFAEISLDALLAAPEAPYGYRPIPRFPSVKVDVALSVPEELAAGDAALTIEAAGKGLVDSMELFDLYRGDSVGAGRKSIAYHVRLQASDRTLSDADVARFLGRLERGIEKAGGELRSE